MKDMKQVVIISGSGGVGKDTFVNFASQYVPTKNFSSIDVVKKIALYAGWDGAKDDKGRKLLSDLKRVLAEYDDIPFKSISACYTSFITSTEKLLFLHIREPDEISRCKKHFNAITLLITRNRNITYTNISDLQVGEYKYCHTINNNGSLSDLQKQAYNFLKLINAI